MCIRDREDPVQSKPVGRIDYLHTDGTVRESVEYTSPYQLEKDIYCLLYTSQKVKVLAKLYDSGCKTEKDLKALSLQSILKIRCV